MERYVNNVMAASEAAGEHADAYDCLSDRLELVRKQADALRDACEALKLAGRFGSARGSWAPAGTAAHALELAAEAVAVMRDAVKSINDAAGRR